MGRHLSHECQTRGEDRRVQHARDDKRRPRAASAAQVSLAEQPVTAESAGLSGDGTAACVSAHLPKGAFKKSPDFKWLCKETDPREGAAKLRTAVVEGAGGAKVTDAMRIFSKLGWYEMAAFELVRNGCCSMEMEALKLPEPSAGCEAMAPVLTDLAKAVTAGQKVDEPIKKTSEAFACEAKKNRASLYRRANAPAAHEETAFRELVKSFAPE